MWYNKAMKFRRVNNNTINCIISKEDLQKNGLHANDLFERKEEALTFIKSVLLRAAREQNMRLTPEYTSMQITILPDQGISLTLSVGEGAESAIAQNEYVYHFESMRSLVSLAKHLGANGELLRSSLYEDTENEGYFLIIGRGEAEGSDYEKMVVAMNEFGTLMTSHPGRITRIKEHNPCLMTQGAIGQLKAL